MDFRGAMKSKPKVASDFVQLKPMFSVTVEAREHIIWSVSNFTLPRLRDGDAYVSVRYKQY